MSERYLHARAQKHCGKVVTCICHNEELYALLSSQFLSQLQVEKPAHAGYSAGKCDLNMAMPPDFTITGNSSSNLRYIAENIGSVLCPIPKEYCPVLECISVTPPRSSATYPIPCSSVLF